MRRLAIYWQEDCENILPLVIDSIRKNFPFLSPEKREVLALNHTCYDPFRSQYDAVELLKTLPNDQISLYLITEDIYFPGYRYLYGAGLTNKAIVSNYRIRTQEGYCKEVCHEMGHVLGLKHCLHHCLMQTSTSEAEIESKGENFCAACQAQLKVMYLRN